jgi:Tol biopolymer transport system component
MSRNPDVLDRLAPLFEPPGRGFEDLLRRRKRKERARKIGAIALVTVMAVAFVGIALGTVDDRKSQPADTPAALFERIHGWIVYRDSSGVVAVDPADPANRISLRSALGYEGGLEPIGWSRDGNRLLGRRGAELFVVSSEDMVIRLTTGSTYLPWWGSISPDGTRVVYANDSDRGLYTIDALGGKPELILRDNREPYRESPAWSPDGSRIALLDFHEQPNHAFGLTVLNADGSGRVVKIEDLGPDVADGLVWSPDGSRLAFFRYADHVASSGRIYVVDTETWKVQRLTNGGDSRWPTWSPDGSRIAFVRDGQLFTMGSDGGDVQKVDGVEPEPDTSIAWNPGGLP